MAVMIAESFAPVQFPLDFSDVFVSYAAGLLGGHLKFRDYYLLVRGYSGS